MSTAVLMIAISTLLSGCSPARVGVPASPMLGKGLRLPEPSMPVASSRVFPPTAMDGVERVQNVLTALQRYDHTGRNPEFQQVYFELPESDINQYLAYSLHTNPRPGFRAITVKLQAGNRISTSMTLNFDRIGDWVPLIPALLHATGDHVVGLDLVFAVQNSAVTFQFVGGPEIDTTLRRILQSLLHVLALHQPEQYDTSKPIRLPYGLQRLWTTSGVMAGGT